MADTNTMLALVMILVSSQVYCRSTAFLSPWKRKCYSLKCFSTTNDQMPFSEETILDDESNLNAKTPWSTECQPTKKRGGINKSRFRQRKLTQECLSNLHYIIKICL